MSFKKVEYIDLLNTLQLKGLSNYVSDWNENDNKNDMMKALAEELKNLQYKGNKKDYYAIKKWLDDKYPYEINFNGPSISNPPIDLSPLDNLKTLQNIESNPLDNLKPPLNIESNPLVNQNFNSNKNMSQRGKYGLNMDPSMEALISLVGEQRKEIKKMEKLMTPERAEEFVYKQNHRFDKKTNQMVEKKNPKFAKITDFDYDGDGITDTVVTKDGKVYSFNCFLPKDTDYPLRREFLMKNKKHKDKSGKDQYDRYSAAQTKSKIINPNAPRERAYKLNLEFAPQQGNFYPAIQKYLKKAQPQVDNATTVISNEILRPVWRIARQLHQGNPEIIDATDGVNYIKFKNIMIDDLFTTPLSQTIPDYVNLKSKKKTEAMNDYFDQNYANQHSQLLQRAITQLILLKSEITQLDQQTGQDLFNVIYNNLKHE
jgi:hypothetical protein